MRIKCVFCFHCMSVSSNSMYPFAKSKPMTLNRHHQQVNHPNDTQDLH